MTRHCQMSESELRLLNETAARHSFASEKEKEPADPSDSSLAGSTNKTASD